MIKSESLTTLELHGTHLTVEWKLLESHWAREGGGDPGGWVDGWSDGGVMDGWMGGSMDG